MLQHQGNIIILNVLQAGPLVCSDNCPPSMMNKHLKYIKICKDSSFTLSVPGIVHVQQETSRCLSTFVNLCLTNYACRVSLAACQNGKTLPCKHISHVQQTA